jgi:ABC-2 type transport system ATP-binding protein
MDEADHYSDEIAIMDKGKMVKFGTASELKHSIRREVIQFNLRNHGVDEIVLKIIRNMDFVSEVAIHNSELNVVVEDAETALPDIMEILRTKGITVDKISTARPTLDDAFLKYAGTMNLPNSIRSETTRRKDSL